MTDIDAALPRQVGIARKPAGMLSVRAAAVLTLSALSIGLAGCETAGGLLGGSSPPVEVAQPPAAPTPQPATYRIALAPIIGAPDTAAKQLAAQLAQAGERQRITLLGERDAKGDYTLRGYVVAARDKTGTKVSFIWDLADGAGKRVHRISGEEVVAAAPNAKDPWAAVTPAALQNISDKTISGLASWLSQQQPTPVASAPQPPAAGVGINPTTPPGPIAQRQTPVSNQTTAALPSNEQPLAAAPVVSGAPGDGNAALAAAIQRELARQGVTMGDRQGAYRVEGQVVLGVVKDGRQPIRIDWRVKDAQGKSLGTVSQNNEIPPGSLDGAWGKTADAAAAAAAQGIIKLLPAQRAAN